MYRFYGWQGADVTDALGRTPRDLYDLLRGIWCEYTCAPRMRKDWSPQNPTLGQCSVTAFLVQDLFGGRVFGVPLEDGSVHCFNVVGGRALSPAEGRLRCREVEGACVFDLTSEQFGGRALDYADAAEQFREEHFAKEEKRLRYAFLKAVLENGGRPRRIALSFDDGPNTSVTPQVLDLLEAYGIRASFFLIGQNITPESAQSARRAAAMGCDLENHSVTHRPMNTLSPEEVREEIRDCSERVTALAGRAPRFFRPPYIAVSPALAELVPLTFIAGKGCNDWMPEVSAQERARLVLEDPQDGEIVLLHDSLGNFATVEALRTVIPALIERGFAFLTVPELFEQCGVQPAPGMLYSNVFRPASLSLSR